MFRIDNTTAAGSLPTPAAAGTPGYFTDGVPGTTAATIVPADWFNAVQEEIAGVIVASGISLSKTDRTQLLAAIRALSTTNRQIFSSPGSATFTVPSSGKVRVTVIGAGGGGGGSSATGASTASTAPGGNGGAYGSKIISGLTPSSTVAVTVGAGGAGGSSGGGSGSAGGTSSFGAYVSSPGGLGGPGAGAFAVPLILGPNTTQQYASGGDLNGGTTFGGFGTAATVGNAASGNGGGSIYGSGAPPVAATLAGATGSVSGVGGSGACSAGGGAGAAGGQGAAGIVIVEW